MKLGIIGGGTVGRATARAFIEHVDEVRVFDEVKERRTHGLVDTLLTDLIFVCLPTPQKPRSLECDLSIIEEFFHFVKTSILGAIPEMGWGARNFVLRSTIPIGTTKRLSQQYNLPNLVHSPEFLTARCSVTDAHLPSRNIVGYVGSTLRHDRVSCASVLKKLYEQRFPGVPSLYMESDESEAVKLGINSLFAVKLACLNNLKQIVDAGGMDWGRVMEGILSDGRISHSHTQIPGHDNRPGFGGACLRKDLANLIQCASQIGVTGEVFQAVHEYNNRLRGCE